VTAPAPATEQSTGRSAGRTARLVVHQYRYDQKAFWRQPESVFFTVALPIIFLFIFVSIFGNDAIPVGARKVKGATYYVPGIVALALVSATVVNLTIALTFQRERGTLKRVRSTPLPPWVFMAGRIMTATVITLMMVVMVTLLGRVLFGVRVPTHTLPGLLATVLAGTATCCAAGFALSGFVPNENAAPAVVNAVVLPLYFFSGVFIPDVPKWMQNVAAIFPVKHIFEGIRVAFDPATTGTGIRPGDLAVLAAWGVGCTLIAARFFRWSSKEG